MNTPEYRTVTLSLIEAVNAFIGKVPMWKAGWWLENNWLRLEPQLRQAVHDAQRVVVLEDENHQLRQRIQKLSETPPAPISLSDILDAIKNSRMTSEELDAQRASWVRGEMGINSDAGESK